MSTPMTTPTETPLIDAAAWIADSINNPDGVSVVCADFARTLEKKLTAATAQLEEARKDKERLDWLEKSNRADLLHCDVSDGFYVEGFDMETKDTVRSAIDAAMQPDHQGANTMTDSALIDGLEQMGADIFIDETPIRLPGMTLRQAIEAAMQPE